MDRRSTRALGWLLCILLVTAGTIAQAQVRDGRALAVGIYAHDRGPVTDRWESGIDLNVEYQFLRWRSAPWGWLTSSTPHVGATINFSGDTNVIYGGLTWPWIDRHRWGLDFSFGLMAHDGDLKGDPERCELLDDCGFGSRVMFRVGFEGLWHFSPDWSASLMYDHVSHARLFDDINEGIDNVGVRLIRRF